MRDTDFEWEYETVSEGPYLDGERTGHWMVESHSTYSTSGSTSGSVLEGPYVDGEMHGRWVNRVSNSSGRGGVGEITYWNGVVRGTVIFRYADGSVSETPYVDGVPHGTAVTRNADGSRDYTTWENGRIVD